MKLSRRIAVVRQQVRQLTALAEKRAAAEVARATPSFRPLTKAEIETILGIDLLAALGGGRRRA